MLKRYKTKIGASTDMSAKISLLFLDSTIHQRIKKIQSLVGITQQDFLKIYIKTVANFIEHIVKKTSSPENITEQISLKLDEVILSLRKRQGYLLPLGADSEQVFREQEIWNYAIFTATLFNDITEKDKFELAQSLIPLEPKQWIKRHSHIFEVWQSYLSLEPTNTIFNEIIQSKNIEDINSKNSILDSNCNNRNQEEKINMILNNTNNILKPKINIADTLKAEIFWEWAIKRIKANPTNTAKYGIYCVELGILLAIPASIDQFINHITDTNDKTLSQPITPLKSRIKLTKEIKKNPLLIRNTQGSRIHTYYKGHQGKHQVISGVIIKTSNLLGELISLAFDPSLIHDPINTI